MIELFVGYFWPNFTLFLLLLVVLALAVVLFMTGSVGPGVATLGAVGLLGYWFVRATSGRHSVQ